MILEEVESKFNGQIKVVKSLGLGKYIQAGGLTQSGGIVEGIWKETLKKVKGRSFEKTLILGLGGGSVAKVIHKNWPQAKIVGVDIDGVMVNLGKKHLGLDEDIVEIRIQDAMDSVFIGLKKKSKYDLICIDLYNGEVFPEKFESDKFLKNVKKLMSEGGVVIFNRLYGSDHRSESMRFGCKLENFFLHVDYIYPQANVALICYN